MASPEKPPAHHAHHVDRMCSAVGVQAKKLEIEEYSKAGMVYEAAKARKAREEKLRKDREEVFGPGSLFVVQSKECLPQSANKFDLESLSRK